MGRAAYRVRELAPALRSRLAGVSQEASQLTPASRLCTAASSRRTRKTWRRASSLLVTIHGPGHCVFQRATDWKRAQAPLRRTNMDSKLIRLFRGFVCCMALLLMTGAALAV